METIAAQTETVSAAADRPQLQLITKDQLCSTYLSENSGSFRELAAIRTEVSAWMHTIKDIAL